MWEFMPKMNWSSLLRPRRFRIIQIHIEQDFDHWTFKIILRSTSKSWLGWPIYDFGILIKEHKIWRQGVYFLWINTEQYSRPLKIFTLTYRKSRCGDVNNFIFAKNISHYKARINRCRQWITFWKVFTLHVESDKIFSFKLIHMNDLLYRSSYDHQQEFTDFILRKVVVERMKMFPLILTWKLTLFKIVENVKTPHFSYLVKLIS